MAKSLMICSNANNALRLNESDNLPSKYILEGVFAELDKLNRNQRIYQKEEYLKHLQYLRNDIKKGEPLLGELDHPDDRFEVKLKEASHRVIDLWYDADKNVVMGKIELLNTPNGKLAQSIVDQGIPLHISSRAAGTVNSDNTVSIQQIYTYDLVCKPGFAGAVLYRVDESADAKTYSADVQSFLSNALKMESLNSAPQYGFLNEDVSVSEIKASANLRKEAKEIQINKQIELNDDMTKPILENTNPDSTVGKPLNIGSGGGAAALGIPTANMGGTNEADKDDASDKKEENEEKEEKDKTSENDASEDKKEACPKCGKNPCECGDKDDKDDDHKDDDKDDDHKTNEGEDDDKSDDDHKDDDKSDDDKDDDKSDDDSSSDDDNKDDDSKDDGVEIIDVTAEFEDGKTSDDMIKDVEAEYDDDKKEDDKDKDSDEDGDKDEDKDSDDEKEDDASEAKDEDAPTDEDDKKAKEAEKLSDKASKDIEDHKDKIFKKLDDLKAAIEKKSSEKKEAKNESIIMAKYPVSMMMNESNFVEFVSLNESQKTKVVNYLQDNNFTDAKTINENWKNGIDYVAEVPVWLKHAPENYKELYEAASEQVKQSINNIAKYVLFENQYDVNRFWENSGLAESNERKLLNESFINNMPKVNHVEENTNLPYGKEFIQQIADMASEYNNRRY